MVKKFLTSLLLPVLINLFLSMTNSALAATLTASVDRKEITENETFRLFLRYDKQAGFNMPDLAPLKKNFKILDQVHSSQERSTIGKNSNSIFFTEWILVLSPKTSGTLIIPPISFDGQFSQEIEITVNKISQEIRNNINQQFFFDIDVDAGPMYVQAQILYTVKVYYTVGHNDPTLNDLNVTDARVIKLGNDRKFMTSIDGQNVGVYERKYAIFPEESGELVIPGQRFNATIPSPYSRLSRGKPISIVTKPVRIMILPAPANYPQAPWLPSPQISISDRWSKPYSEWQVGEPVTRNITINAQGLSGSQLPSIALPIVEGLKYYPDQSEHQDHTDSSGIQGVYQQSLAIVPTQSGRITVPEMRIPWWNIETNRLEYAILPAQTVDVAAAANTSSTKSSQEASQQVSGQTILTPSQQGSSGYWIFATLALLISNILTAFFLWKKSDETRVKEDKIPEVNGKAILKQLKSACHKNDALKIRHYLKEWAQSEYKKNSIEEFGKLFNDIALTNAIAELDSFLYQDTQNSVFNGQVLWNSLSQAIKKRDPKENSDSSSLKPLYQ